MGMLLQLPKPQLWQDFEEMCCDLWKSIWGDPNTQIHGRRGQKQNGVDILGRPAYSHKYHAVQCKGKDDNNLAILSPKEIDKECKEAQSIQPSIEEFIIASTANRDINHQKHCRELTQNHSYPFGVNVWSWEDISMEIQCRPEMLDRYYSSIKGHLVPSYEIAVDRYSSQDLIAAFLSRPNIKAYVSRDMLELLYPTIYELVDNAFAHGNAGCFRISFNNNELVLIDNGDPFDIHKLLEAGGQGGAKMLRYLVAELDPDISFEYQLNDKKENVTTFVFSNGVMLRPLKETIEITRDYSSKFGRKIGECSAKADYDSIPSYKKQIVINVVGDFGLGPSYADAYFNKFCGYLNEEQSVKVYLPEAARCVLDHVLPLKEKFPIDFVLRK